MNLEPSVIISVISRFLPDHDASNGQKYAFAYRVTIHNPNPYAVTLLRRYWLVVDGNGKQMEVKGDGVLGKQPTLAPGEEYQYTSGAVIDTPVGSMEGYYEMESENGEPFRAPIERFRLVVPNAIN